MKAEGRRLDTSFDDYVHTKTQIFFGNFQFVPISFSVNKSNNDDTLRVYDVNPQLISHAQF